MTDEKKKEQQEQNTTAPASSVTEMEQNHAEEMAALQQVNQQQYTDVGQIVSEAESRLAALQQKDEAAQKRSNAFRYIAGLGDTLSGIANLVGTAHGAQNQQQTYNSNIVAEKAEQARKERKLETDKISARLDEMRARQRELKAAGSLAEAELKAKQAREVAAERIRQETVAREDAWRDKQQAWKEEEAARAQENWNKNFEQSKKQWQQNYNLQYAKLTEEQRNKDYNFTFADGSIDVPKEKLNDVNVERIYKMLPEEVRNAVKGEAYTEYETDEYGNQKRTTGYKAPTLYQKLAAIGAYADNDENIRNELRVLAGEKRVEKKDSKPETEPTVGAKTGTDWSAYATSSVKTSGNATQKEQPASSKALRDLEDSIMKNDSFYINGERYAKL